jgi:acyl carrier protein
MTYQKIVEILKNYTDNELVDTKANLDEFGIDSLALVEIIFDIEEAFDIKIPDEQTLAEKNLSLATLEDVVNLVTYLQQQGH